VTRAPSPSQRITQDLLCLGDDRAEMRFALEAFGIELVNIFSAGDAGDEPAAFADDFELTDAGALAASELPSTTSQLSLSAYKTEPHKGSDSWLAREIPPAHVYDKQHDLHHAFTTYLQTFVAKRGFFNFIDFGK
jgi:hypothetical protein